MLCPSLFSQTAAKPFRRLKFHAHKAVQVYIGGGKLRPPESSRIIVHAYHDIVTPDIQSAVREIIIFFIAGKVLLHPFRIFRRPSVISDIIADDAYLAAEEGLVHVHQDSFLMFHIQIRLRPVCHLNHHGNIAVLQLMIEKVANIAFRMLNQPFLHSPVRIAVRQIQQTVHRPKSIPVPHVSVIYGARIDKGITDKIPGLLQNLFRMFRHKCFQPFPVPVFHFFFHSALPFSLILCYPLLRRHSLLPAQPGTFLSSVPCPPRSPGLPLFRSLLMENSRSFHLKKNCSTSTVTMEFFISGVRTYHINR